jgi:short-subunit dehydrogenase
MQDVLYIVTGTTRGIGHEFKKILLDNSSKLISINRNKADKYDYKMDLSHIDEVGAMSYHLREKIKKDYVNHKIVFVNNAFSLNPIGKLSEYRNYQIASSLNTNIYSPLTLIKLLTEAPNPLYIINITSGAAHSVNKHLGIYSSSKLFIENYLKFIEIENNNCVKVANFNPGITKTNMYETLSSSDKFQNNSFEKAIPNDPAIVASDLYNLSKEIVSD